MFQSKDEEPACHSQIREIGEKIRQTVLKDEVHFKRAGEYIDHAFDEDAVRRDYAARGDTELEALGRIGMCFAQFDLAVGHYFEKRRPPIHELREQERLLAARTILLLTWLITDPDADLMKPALTDLQNWAWGVDADGMPDPVANGDADDVYHRSLSRKVLLSANGTAWAELATEAWHLHAQDLAKHRELLNAAPGSQSLSRPAKGEPKYVRFSKSLEQLIRSNKDKPIDYLTLSKRYETARKTIKRAIEHSTYLSRIYREYGRKKSARQRPMTQGLLESTPQSTEIDPAEAAEIEDKKLNQLIVDQKNDMQRDQRQSKTERNS